MENRCLQKYILIIISSFIILHLICIIYHHQKSLNELSEQKSFDFYLVTKPQNCFYQAKNGFSFVLKNCQKLKYSQKYRLIGKPTQDVANNLFSLKMLTVSHIYENNETSDSVFDFFEQKWAVFAANLDQQRIFLANRASPYFNSKNSLLPVSLTLGSRAATLDKDFKNQVNQIGIAHLLAVSGSHLATIVALMELPLKRLPLKIFSLALALILIWYTVLIGSGASIVRATLMFILSLIYRNFFYKQFSALFGLFLSVIIILGFSPGLITDIGFLLSVAATSGIIFLVNWQQRRRNLIIKTTGSTFGAKFETVKGLILTSLVAQAFVSLITVEAFGQFNLVGPLATLILSPLIEPLMVTTVMFYLILGFSIWLNLDFNLILIAFARLIDRLSDVFSWSVAKMATWPATSLEISAHFTWEVWLFYYLVLIIILWPTRRQMKQKWRYV